jgi:hypothetical protein
MGSSARGCDRHPRAGHDARHLELSLDIGGLPVLVTDTASVRET